MSRSNREGETPTGGGRASPPGLASVEELDRHLAGERPDPAAVVAFVRSGNHDDATRRVLRRAIRRAQANVAARIGLVAASVAAGDRDTAIREAVSVLRHAPDREEVLTLLPPGDSDQVRARAARDRELDARVGSAVSDLEGGAVAGPLARLRAIARSEPTYVRAQATHQAVCAEKGLVVEARALLEAVRSAGPVSQGTLVASAKAFLAANAEDDAVAAIAEVAMVAPQHGDLPGLLDGLRARPGAVEKLRTRLEASLADGVDRPAVALLVRSLTPQTERGAPFLEEARRMTEAGRPAEAARAWMQWAETAPDHDRFLRAAREVEALGENGRAEFLYNHAIRYRRDSPEATLGLTRVKAAKAGAPREPATDYRDLAERTAAAGDVVTASTLLLTWAERENNVAVYLDAARRLVALDRADSATALLKRAETLAPDDPEVIAALYPPAPVDPFDAGLALIEGMLTKGNFGGAAVEAGRLATGCTRLAEVRTLARVMDTGGVALAAWVPAGDSPGAVFGRLLQGAATLPELLAAGLDEDSARTELALAALRAGRWGDALEHDPPADGIVGRVVRYYARGTNAFTVRASEVRDRVATHLVQVLSDLPALRRPAATTPAPFRTAMVAGIEAFGREDFDAALARFEAAAGVDERNAWVAWANAALTHMRAGRPADASRYAIRASRKAPRDPAVRWVSAAAAVHIEAFDHAAQELGALADLDAAHVPARVALALVEMLGERWMVGVSRVLDGPSDPVDTLLRDQALAGIVVDALLLERDNLGAAALLRTLGDAIAGMDLVDPEVERSAAAQAPRKGAPIQEIRAVVDGLLLDGRTVEAERVLAAYLDRSPTYVPARMLRYEVWAQLGWREAAIRGLQELLAEGANNRAAAVGNALARLLLSSGQVDEAHELLANVVLPRWSENVDARELLAHADRLLATSRMQEPDLTTHARLPVIPPEPGRRWFEQYAQLAEELEEVPAAVAALRGFTERKKFVPAFHALARLLERSGKPGEAVDELERAIGRVVPERRAGLAVEALRILEAGDPDGRAVRLLERLPAVAWESPELRGRVDKLAEVDASGAVGMVAAQALWSTAGVEARAHLARTLRQAPDVPGGRAFAAEHAPELLQTIDPAVVRKQLNQFRTQPARALQVAERAHTQAPFDDTITRLYIDALRSAGEADRALATARELAARTLRREDRLLLADLLAQAGDSEGELEVFGPLLDADPFEPEVHRRLRESGRGHLARFPGADPALLGLASAYVDRSDRNQLRRDFNTQRMALIARLDACAGDPSAESIRAELQLREPHLAAWASSRPTPIAPPVERARAAEAAVTVTVTGPAPAPPIVRPVEVRTAIPEAETAGSGGRARDPERRRSAYDRFKGAADPARALYDILDTVSPQFWRAERDALVDVSDEPVELVSTLFARVQRELERLPTPTTALLLEAAWLGRVYAHLLKRQPGQRRDGRRRSRGEPADRQLDRQLRLADALERDVVPPFLRVVSASDEGTSDALLVEFGTVVSRALPEQRRDLGLAMRTLAQAGDALRLLRAATERDEHAQRALGADRFVRALGRPGSHVAPPVKTALKELEGALLKRLSAVRQAVDTAAHLRVEWGTPAADTPGAFRVPLRLANAGDVPARQVVLRMRPVGIELTLPSGALPDLPPRGTAEIEVRVSGVEADRGAVVLDGTLEYRASDALVGREGVAGVVVPPWITPKPPPDSHLYKRGNPVVSTDKCYVDRPEPLRKVFAALNGEGTRSPVLVYGLRRMGKSTLSLAAAARLAGTHARAWVSLESYKATSRRDGQFLYSVCLAVRDAIEARGVTGARLHDLDAFIRLPFDRTEEYLRDVGSRLGELRVLLIFDEFQYIFQMIDQGEFQRGMVGFLRGLIQSTPWLDVVVIGGDRVLDEIRNYEAPLFNLFLPVRVAYLEEQEARQLVLKPSEKHFTWDTRAVDRVVEETNGHPYFLQWLCLEIVESLKGRDAVTWLDVEWVISRMLETDLRGDQQELTGMLRGHPMDYQLILAALADLTAAGDKPRCTVAEIEAHLVDAECPVDDVATPLLALEGMNLVRGHRQPDHSVSWEVAMPLLGRWVRRYDHFSMLTAQAARSAAGDAEDAR